MGTQLLRVPIFARAIEKCDAVLKPKGINIVHILTSLDSHLFDNILNSFVGISAIQVRRKAFQPRLVHPVSRPEDDDDGEKRSLFV